MEAAGRQQSTVNTAASEPGLQEGMDTAAFTAAHLARDLGKVVLGDLVEQRLEPLLRLLLLRVISARGAQLRCTAETGRRSAGRHAGCLAVLSALGKADAARQGVCKGANATSKLQQLLITFRKPDAPSSLPPPSPCMPTGSCAAAAAGRRALGACRAGGHAGCRSHPTAWCKVLHRVGQPCRKQNEGRPTQLHSTTSLSDQHSPHAATPAHQPVACQAWAAAACRAPTGRPPRRHGGCPGASCARHHACRAGRAWGL